MPDLRQKQLTVVYDSYIIRADEQEDEMLGLRCDANGSRAVPPVLPKARKVGAAWKNDVA